MRNFVTLRMAAAVLGLVATFGCGPSHPSRAQNGETCFGTPIDCNDRAVESCCTQNQCAYRVSDGADFPCKGTDCSDAANEVAAYCKS